MKKITLALLFMLPCAMVAQTTFDFTNSNEGFEAIEGTLTPGETASILELNTTDDTNTSIENLNAGINSDDSSFAVITLKNNSNNEYLRFSYPRPGDTEGRRAFRNQVITSNDSEFQTYIVDLTGQFYTGIVDDIQVTIKLDANTNSDASGGTIEIDQIEFTNNPPTIVRNDYAFDTDGDVEGWNGSGGVNASASNGALVVDFTGANNNGRINQDTYGINADLGDFLHVVVINNSANDEIRISYPNTEPDGGNFVFRTAPIDPNSAETQVIDIDVSSASWSGLVENFRLQLRESGGGTLPAGNAEIDRIVFDNNETLSFDRTQNFVAGLYPNPVVDVLYFNTEDVLKSVAIYNMNGQKVLEVIPTNNSVDVSGLSTGVYITTIVDENDNSLSKKFIIK
ncbi:Por secretion system C-terminal sorting domain-containing protein [Nonlabens sp. Hel1_33_55]|uniref:T9SS type A sorting domain-containing protein n=1 Tax=Nonlabens sp. Hel1_33_55 TaxID=1336802 RepID=UPI000875D0C0|nr:T9SS type A sorting domain-containing protein [Nonlabens sp. Hel1_33_55]SCX99970.1 Por secretion system C-terminal sorting domain-containing protein [Nonlabens sp. Hel1_33_55]